MAEKDNAADLVYGNENAHAVATYGRDTPEPGDGADNQHPAKQDSDKMDPMTDGKDNAGFPE